MKAMRRNRRRLISLSAAVLVVVIGGAETALIWMMNIDTENRLLAEAMSQAVSAAHMISMDAEAYRELSRTKDTGSTYYKRMHRHLREIKELNGDLKFITTENRIDATTTEFILDAEPIGGPNYVEPGHLGDNHADKDPVFTTGAATNYGTKKGKTSNKWGKNLAGYAAIRADDGEILGIVGVDIDQRRVWTSFYRTIIVLVIADLVIIGLFAASVFGFSSAILDRMFRDKLTGAFTRRHFEVLLGDGISRCIKYKHGLALMMLDLDHFKNVNDTYGHPFGDKVLATFSEVIRGSIRPEDSFIRYGGEEFALIVASAGAKNVMDVAERLRAAVEGRPIFNEEHNTLVRITVSIGVARFVNLSQTPKELVDNADKALYRAKVTRNAVKLFE